MVTNNILEEALSLSRDAIFIFDSSLKIVQWNDSCERVFGFSKQEVVGEIFTNILVEAEFQDVLNEGLNNFSEDNHLFNDILSIYGIKKNQDTFSMELQLNFGNDEESKLIYAVARDISDRVLKDNKQESLIEELKDTKQLTEKHASELADLNYQLHVSETKLIDQNESKDQFFSIIAHDLKGPFQGILGYSEILSQGIETLTFEEIEEFANSVYVSARHMYKLLEDLLHWSRVQRGVITCSPESIDLFQLAKINIDLAEQRAKFKEIKLVNNIPENTLAYFDENMINTVIRNLISNAIKFTNKGDEVGLNTKILDSGFVEITIFDTGIGMEQKIQDKLFKVGVKHTTVGTANEEGTGFGLLLCKDLTEKNHGKIRIESKLGIGSKFIFTLPTTQAIFEEKSKIQI